MLRQTVKGLLARKLRPRGDLRLLLQLPKMFGQA